MNIKPVNIASAFSRSLPQIISTPRTFVSVRRFVVACAAMLFCVSTFAEYAQAEEFKLHFRNGDVISFDVQSTTIGWLSVGTRGEMKKVEIPLAEIESLSLTSSPASEQLSKIRLLIAQLSSQNYLEREQAEQELRVTGRRFRKFLEQESETGSAESNYRLNRVIGQLKGSREDESEELDKLVYTIGKSVDGDAGEFSLKCIYRGDEIVIERSGLRKISRPKHLPNAVDANPATKIEVEMFHAHEDFVDKKTQREIDFSKSTQGKTLSREDDVADAFVDAGLKFSTPNEKGFVGISGYPFSFESLPVGGNSICVYRTRRTTLRFQGEMEISFCMPGQPGVAAGVHEFGLFLARVQHSRDFIVEAYDEMGHLLATVEATDQQCSFHGLRSNQPIARIRILSNPYLDKVTRVVDVDYAVDTVFVSKKPVPIRSPGSSKNLSFRNGDSITPRKIDFTKDGNVEFTTASRLSRTVGIGELTTLGFSAEPKAVQPADGKKEGEDPRGGDGRWKILLEDNSVLLVEPGRSFMSSLLDREFKPQDVVAVWPASEKMRYPVSGDFKRGPSVLVYPTCRIATLDLEFIKDGFAWKEADKLEEKLKFNKKRKNDDVDPTPDGKIEYYANKKPKDQPTVWLRQPMSVPDSQGVIRLSDGQVIVYGDQSRFKLEEIRPSESAAPTVVVKFDDKTVTIHGSEIKSISPAK